MNIWHSKSQHKHEPSNPVGAAFLFLPLLFFFFFFSPSATRGARPLAFSFRTPSSRVGGVPGEAGVGGGGAGATKFGGVITPSVGGEPTSTNSTRAPFFFLSFGRKPSSSSWVYLTLFSCSFGSEVRAAARSTWLMALESFFSWCPVIVARVPSPIKALNRLVSCQGEQRSPWGRRGGRCRAIRGMIGWERKRQG